MGQSAVLASYPQDGIQFSVEPRHQSVGLGLVVSVPLGGAETGNIIRLSQVVTPHQFSPFSRPALSALGPQITVINFPAEIRGARTSSPPPVISQPDDILRAGSVSQEPPSVFSPSCVIAEPSGPQELRLQQSGVSLRVGLGRRNVIFVELSLRPYVVKDGGELPLALIIYIYNM